MRAIDLALHAVGLAEHPDRAQGKARSNHWPLVREEHLHSQPSCQVCGAKKNVVVHHLEPFHLFPALELDPLNLITLCEGPGVNCHLLFGHLNNFSSYNPACLEDVDEWREKIERRPGKDDVVELP